MLRKTKAWLIIIVGACAAGVGTWIYISGLNQDPGSTTYPDTLPVGAMPTMYLPITNFSNVDMIGGYGQVNPSYFHPGIDICINDTTPIVAPCNAYVSLYQPNYYNEIGHVYQTNMELRLNAQWTIGIGWESDSANETYSTYQAGNISVTLGTYVTTNQSLGMLLCHGPNSRMHFAIKSNGIWACPYHFLNCTARALFEEQFDRVGDKMYCGCCYCCD